MELRWNHWITGASKSCQRCGLFVSLGLFSQCSEKSTVSRSQWWVSFELILTNFQSGFFTVVLDEENRVCQILYIHSISKWCVPVFFIHQKTHNLLCHNSRRARCVLKQRKPDRYHSSISITPEKQRRNRTKSGVMTSTGLSSLLPPQTRFPLRPATRTDDNPAEPTSEGLDSPLTVQISTRAHSSPILFSYDSASSLGPS